MDDGEVEPSDMNLMQNSSTSTSNNVNIIIDEFLRHRRTTCTYTRTCNPPGPEAIHTHTCYHTHTQVFSSEEDTKNKCDFPSLKPRRPLGNREAVRKYREKKKAHTAFLEEEVKKLRLLNQHLVRLLQSQAPLEAELLRLRVLFVDVRGKIDRELDTFQFSDTDISSRFKLGDGGGIQSAKSKAIRLQYQTQVPCFLPQGNPSLSPTNGHGADNDVFSWQEECQPVSIDCQICGNGMVGASDNPIEGLETLVTAKNHCP